jgi:amidase
LTANVADNALFLEVMAGPDGLDPRQGNAKVDKYTKAVGQPIKGLKIGVVKEGFGQYDSHPDVDAGVRAAIKRLEGLGCEVKEISIPWHTNGISIWSAIALEGTYQAVMNGASIGRNVEGVYPVSLAARLATIRDRANELPHTVKVGLLLGAYTDRFYQGYFYYKSQNLRRRLRAAYTAALDEHDLLVMPTTRVMASKIPPADAPLPAIMAHSWEQIGNTCPFNVTHHPAISIPCGYGEGGRPIGLMFIAKHWQESMLYRAAHAYEQSTDWQKDGPARKK